MKYRALPRVVAVHMALMQEREAVVERLEAINETFGLSERAPVRKGGKQVRQAEKPEPSSPLEPHLIRLVVEFTQHGPKPVVEILQYLRAKKHRFQSASPLNELLAAAEKSNLIVDYGGKLGIASEG
ncbi:MAG TPA: hypothetical protein VMF06_16055 [Candidatus Limnocylindria bacterium]|nr:hypothetical protein [Candidatus Limnocylindria bacterium]